MKLLNRDMGDQCLFVCQPDNQVVPLCIVGGFQVFTERFASNCDAFVKNQFCFREGEGVSLDGIGVVGMQEPHLFVQFFDQIPVKRAQCIKALTFLLDPFHEMSVSLWHIGIGWFLIDPIFVPEVLKVLIGIGIRGENTTSYERSRTHSRADYLIAQNWKLNRHGGAHSGAAASIAIRYAAS
jgi:hypothetical protein